MFKKDLIMKLEKSIILMVFTSGIYGCGGGSGETTTPAIKAAPAPIANLTLDISTKSVQMDEGTSGTIIFSANYSGSKPLTYTIEVDGVEGLAVTQAGEELTLTVSDMTQIINNATVKLDVTDGSVSDSDSLSVSIINTSFFITRDNLVESLSGVKTFAENNMEAYNAIVFLTDIDVKTGLLPIDSLAHEIDRRGVAIDDARSNLSEEAQSLITSLNDYNSESEGSESELDTYTQQIQSTVDSYVTAINSVYLDVRSTGGDLLPEISFTSLSKSGDSNSLFIGNLSMGNDDSGTWSFSENYAFLESVINSNVCYTL
jgi:hypothetical protein